MPRDRLDVARLLIKYSITGHYKQLLAKNRQQINRNSLSLIFTFVRKTR